MKQFNFDLQIDCGKYQHAYD